jgi:transcriptional regulator with XRE-family HTH domain
MTQLDLAQAIGYEQAYLSSIELGLKNPSQEFLTRLMEKIRLSDEDRQELESALKESNRRFSLPHGSSTETFLFCNALWAKLDRLHPAVLEAMHSMLRLDDQIVNRPRQQPSRLRRRQSKEASM